MGIAVGGLAFLFLRNCVRKRKDDSGGGGAARARPDLRVQVQPPPGAGVPVAFPPPTPELPPRPDGKMAQSYPHVADQLEALARRVQGETGAGGGGSYGRAATTAAGGGSGGPGVFFSEISYQAARSVPARPEVVSYYPAPEDRVARIHPDLAGQLAAIASRVANENQGGAGTANIQQQPTGWQEPGQQQQPPPRPYYRNYSLQAGMQRPPATEPLAPAGGMGGRGSPSPSYTGSDLSSSSLESLTPLSRESVQQMGFRHPVNHWVHLQQPQGAAANNPSPSRAPPPMPPPPLPRPQVAAYDRPWPARPQVEDYDMSRY